MWVGADRVGVLLALMTREMTTSIVGLLYCEATMVHGWDNGAGRRTDQQLGGIISIWASLSVCAVCWLLALTRLLPLTMLPILFVSEFVQWNLGL
jgi:hypothetical protein